MEKVCLVIPTNVLLGKKTFQGYVQKDFYNYIDTILNSKHQKFLLRNSTSENQKTPVEQDPSYKQPIAYILLLYNNQLFIYERAPKEASSEVRLASKLSIGIGGHIEPHDHDPKVNLLISSLQREIAEEINLNPNEYELQHLGYININATEVDLVHFGLVYLAKIKDNTVKIDQKELVHGLFINISDLKNPDIYPRLEGWSKTLVNNIDKISTIF